MLTVGKLTDIYRRKNGILYQKYMFSLNPVNLASEEAEMWESYTTFGSLASALQELDELTNYLWHYPTAEDADDLREYVAFLSGGIKYLVQGPEFEEDDDD